MLSELTWKYTSLTNLETIKQSREFIANQIRRGRVIPRNNLIPVAIKYWHSKPKLRSQLTYNARIHDFLSVIGNCLPSMHSILLHIPSTHILCDNCRHQLSGVIFSDEEIHPWVYHHRIMEDTYKIFKRSRNIFRSCRNSPRHESRFLWTEQSLFFQS